MSIRFRCQSCQKSVKAPDKLAGITINCPGCGESMRIPTLEEAAALAESAPKQRSTQSAAAQQKPAASPAVKRQEPKQPASTKTEPASKPAAARAKSSDPKAAPRPQAERKPTQPAAQQKEPQPKAKAKPKAPEPKSRTSEQPTEKPADKSPPPQDQPITLGASDEPAGSDLPDLSSPLDMGLDEQPDLGNGLEPLAGDEMGSGLPDLPDLDSLEPAGIEDTTAVETDITSEMPFDAAGDTAAETEAPPPAEIEELPAAEAKAAKPKAKKKAKTKAASKLPTPARQGAGWLHSPVVDGVLVVLAVSLSLWAYVAGSEPLAANWNAFPLQAASGAPGLTVRVDGNNQIHLQNQQLSGPAELVRALRGSAPPSAQVVAEEGAAHQTVLLVVEALGQSGVRSVQLASP